MTEKSSKTSRKGIVQAMRDSWSKTLGGQPVLPCCVNILHELKHLESCLVEYHKEHEHSEESIFKLNAVCHFNRAFTRFANDFIGQMVQHLADSEAKPHMSHDFVNTLVSSAAHAQTRLFLSGLPLQRALTDDEVNELQTSVSDAALMCEFVSSLSEPFYRMAGRILTIHDGLNRQKIDTLLGLYTSLMETVELDVAGDTTYWIPVCFSTEERDALEAQHQNDERRETYLILSEIINQCSSAITRDLIVNQLVASHAVMFFAMAQLNSTTDYDLLATYTHYREQYVLGTRLPASDIIDSSFNEVLDALLDARPRPGKGDDDSNKEDGDNEGDEADGFKFDEAKPVWTPKTLGDGRSS